MENLSPEKYNSNRLILVLIIIVLLGGFLLRGIYLTADPPKDITISGGIISDPGQYSYGARNKVLFDQWSFAEYKPYAFSPVFNLINYYIYKYLGISLVTHRLIPLFFSCFILILLSYLAWKNISPLASLFTSIFLAFNYPIIIYSKIGYREYPMTFFILWSFVLFAKAIEKDKINYYVFSSFLFFLGFLSKGSGGYLISVFFVAGVIWLIEKKIKFNRLLIFFSSFTFFMLGWYFLIYRGFFDIMSVFFRLNNSARKIKSVENVLENLYNSPFMLTMRSDPMVILIAILSILFYLNWRMVLKTRIKPFMELSILWLLAGVFFHGMVNYRPTRFYLILIIPVTYLAGQFLFYLWKGKLNLPVNLRSTLSIIFIITIYISIGTIPFIKYFSKQNELLQILFYFLIIIVFLSIFSNGKWPLFSKTCVVLIILFSLYSNQLFFKKWVIGRQYQIKNISSILNKRIPSSKIAGNWASILSIGTNHKTYYAWKNFFNWDKKFLSKNSIQYLLLAKGPFANELKDYQNFFVEEFKRANLIAQFSLFTAQVYLYKLNGISSTRIECETFFKNTGSVLYQKEASSDLIVNVKREKKNRLLASLSRNISIIAKKDMQLTIQARGRFTLRVILIGEGTFLKKKVLFNDQNLLKKKNIYLFSKKSVFNRIELQVLKQSGEIFLDYLDLEAHSEPNFMIIN